MDELQELKNDLKDFRDGVVKLSYLFSSVPELPQVDCENLLNMADYWRGYLDCMINHKIQLQSLDKS